MEGLRRYGCVRFSLLLAAFSQTHHLGAAPSFGGAARQPHSSSTTTCTGCTRGVWHHSIFMMCTPPYGGLRRYGCVRFSLLVAAFFQTHYLGAAPNFGCTRGVWHHSRGHEQLWYYYCCCVLVVYHIWYIQVITCTDKD